MEIYGTEKDGKVTYWSQEYYPPEETDDPIPIDEIPIEELIDHTMGEIVGVEICNSAIRAKLEGKVLVKKCCLICKFFEDNDISDDCICWLHTLKIKELKKEGKSYDNVPSPNVKNKFIMNCDGWFELNEELL